jgi:hypothetical protein
VLVGKWMSDGGALETVVLLSATSIDAGIGE